MNPLFSGQANLAFQIVVLVLLFVSLSLKQRRKYLAHGMTMSIAVVLNALSFLLMMLPSLLNMEIVKTEPFRSVSIAAIAHASLGVVTVVFTFWLVASWHFQSSTQNCARRKKMMRTTLTLWLIVLLLGFALYYFLYAY
jgi:uncharacterized membrane protein YozB (DUF420 family)